MRSLLPALLLAGCASSAPAWEGVLAEQRGTAKAERAVEGLQLECGPAEAEVLLDGVMQGRCGDLEPPRQIAVDASPHRLEVRMVGHASYRAELMAGNARTRLTVRLVPLN